MNDAKLLRLKHQVAVREAQNASTAALVAASRGERSDPSIADAICRWRAVELDECSSDEERAAARYLQARIREATLDDDQREVLRRAFRRDEGDSQLAALRGRR